MALKELVCNYQYTLAATLKIHFFWTRKSFCH